MLTSMCMSNLRLTSRNRKTSETHSWSLRSSPPVSDHLPPISSLQLHGCSLRQAKFARISSPAPSICLGGSSLHPWSSSLSILFGRREESSFVTILAVPLTDHGTSGECFVFLTCKMKVTLFPTSLTVAKIK